MHIRSLIAGLFVGVLLATAAAAGAGTRMAELVYRGIGIQVNGKALAIPEGREPFILDGTTYVPLRLVTEAMGAEVQWEASSNQVVITSSLNGRLSLKSVGADIWRPDGGWWVNYTGIIVNETGGTVRDPSISCRMLSNGKPTALQARTLRGSIKPYSTMAFEFNTLTYYNIPEPDQRTLQCEVVG